MFIRGLCRQRSGSAGPPWEPACLPLPLTRLTERRVLPEPQALGPRFFDDLFEHGIGDLGQVRGGILERGCSTARDSTSFFVGPCLLPRNGLMMRYSTSRSGM